MSPSAHNVLPKSKGTPEIMNPFCIGLTTSATTAAADPYCSAVALAERFAAFVSFQWQQPGHPLHKNVNSAPRSLTSACHFSGKYAQIATFGALEPA